MRSLATPRRASLRRWLGVFVVLVFGIKALIPQGYMVATADGHARLVICPAGLHYDVGMRSMPGMAHGSALDHGAHPSVSADHCPFALAAGAAFFTSADTPAEARFVILPPTRMSAPDSIPVATPSRHHAPRGPPLFA